LLRKKGENRIILVIAVFFIMFTLLGMNYYALSVKQTSVRAAEKNAQLTINAGESQGTIYDRNMNPLVNTRTICRAVVVPSAVNADEIAAYAADSEDFCRKYSEGQPFVFECAENTPESDGLTVFRIPERYSADRTACHVTGCLSDGHGAEGIEYAFDGILRNQNGENSVTYIMDGFGHVMIGDGKKVRRSSADKGGVVTTIDRDIQRICEDCGKSVKKGAIVAADIESGDILAMASFPSYDIADLEKAVTDEDCPLINRTLYSYSVGSIFKLVTAAEAIEEGMGGMMYDCSGNIDVNGQIFNCHKCDGHGLQDMGAAMTNSCNTYFISLAETLDIGKFRERAYSLGFGRENFLCTGINGSAGILPTVGDLQIPAELANFSFGQGRLTATPLQITQLACTIANNGEMPMLRLIKGLTVDGEYVSGEKLPRVTRVMEEETAVQLRKMMVSAVRDNSNSNARSKKVSVGAKTSTAQTGRFDKKGEELCNAWITGFFPSRKPKYAVTVLIEDGGYGNDAAAPIFRKIAEEVMELRMENYNIVGADIIRPSDCR
jgi:penicillin-binding protein 2